MDSTEDGGDDVTLLVKAPDQQINDQTVKCKFDWTVARLKDHLAQVYPSKPKREEQKIIFSGQVLNDSMILKDVLQHYYNKDDRLFIVHLVCGGQTKFSSTTDKTIMSNGNGSGSTVHAEGATTAEAPQSTQSTPVQQYYSQLNNQQMAWMQQAYTHYLTQYMQLMAAQGIQLQSTSPLNAQPQNASGSDAVNGNNATTNNNNGEENDEGETRGTGAARAGIEAVDAAPPVGQELAGDAANVANNNGPADDAVGAALNRDWLDIFDVLSRIVVLASIVYFYSSLSRLLIVTFLAFAIYLIQGGFFRGQPAFLPENNNARVENNNQEGQNEAAPPPVQQAPRIPSATPDEHGDAARTNLNEENERPGAWAFTWTFFSSFFASLIPDQPNVI